MPSTASKSDPPISPATLRAWWTMCLTIKDSDAWTHDEIRAFYDRCFPDKFLSRDRQRDLRGSDAKRGPKGP